MHLYFCLLNLGNNLSAWRNTTVCKSSLYITSVCVPLWSNHLSWVRIRCEAPQLWRQLRVCCGFFYLWNCCAVGSEMLMCGFKCWCLFLSWLYFAPSTFQRCQGAGRGEKLDACKCDSVLCKMAMFLCLIALSRVMIVSEMLSFIKWVWATVYKKHLRDRLHFQGIQAIILN